MSLNLIILVLVFLNTFNYNQAEIFFEGSNKNISFIKYQEYNILPENSTYEVVQSDASDVNGKLVYLDFPDYYTDIFIIPWINTINQYAERGAVGIITSQKKFVDRRYYGLFYYTSRFGETKITTGFISRKDYNEFLGNGKPINVTFFSWDKNGFDTIYKSIQFNYVYRILLPIIYFVVMAVCAFKIIFWRIKNRKFTFSIGLICLILEFFTNLDRFILAILFPSYNLYSLPGIECAITIPMCLNCITGILVIFFWFDLTLDPFFHKNGKCLGIMRIPSIVTIVILVLTEIVTDLLRTLLPLDVFYFGVYYMVIKLLLAIFYFIAAVKILHLSKESPLKDKFRSITRRIVWSGVATIGSTLCMFVFSSPLVYPPPGYVVDWFILNVFWFLQSLFLVIIFNPEKKKKKKSNTSNSPKIELSTNSNPHTPSTTTPSTTTPSPK